MGFQISPSPHSSPLDFLLVTYLAKIIIKSHLFLALFTLSILIIQYLISAFKKFSFLNAMIYNYFSSTNLSFQKIIKISHHLDFLLPSDFLLS
ncbi:unnamed protein product [Meloidogyne enterolobii]|uniref:Uncharacterized protein n=1 Tax=Meloidogyne enterolobii TaxID=390850 RepID=A0ACB0ZZM7_MELEN